MSNPAVSSTGCVVATQVTKFWSCVDAQGARSFDLNLSLPSSHLLHLLCLHLLSFRTVNIIFLTCSAGLRRHQLMIKTKKIGWTRTGDITDRHARARVLITHGGNHLRTTPTPESRGSAGGLWRSSRSGSVTSEGSSSAQLDECPGGNRGAGEHCRCSPDPGSSPHTISPDLVKFPKTRKPPNPDPPKSDPRIPGFGQIPTFPGIDIAGSVQTPSKTPSDPRVTRCF